MKSIIWSCRRLYYLFVYVVQIIFKKFSKLSAIMKLGRRSKPSNKNGVLKRPKSRSQLNIAGYEKRLARKAKSNPTVATDLYEHVPEKTHRSKVTLDVGRDEEFEFGDGEEEDDEREQLRARLIGENEDDEKIPSDDDEELDSDAAFEESDEERFGGFFLHKVCICFYFRTVEPSNYCICV